MAHALDCVTDLNESRADSMLRAYSKSEGTSKRRVPGRPLGDPSRVAYDYAAHLLGTLGIEAAIERGGPDLHPALAWAASGSMALTGATDGPPAFAPGHVVASARGALRALAALADGPRAQRTLAALDGGALLGERAAILGLSRRGTVSAGAHCRLVRARDGWIAVNLPRPDDLASVPAWLERPIDTDPWNAITDEASARTAASVVTRGRLLGLAVAPAAIAPPVTPPWCRVAARGRGVTPTRTPCVLDLSALWAGPLAGSLLQLAGARVGKVESVRRPDGARRGPAAFFDLLHAGKASVTLDFATVAGRAALHRLIARADIVIESARPRAAHQLGIDPAALVRARPGLTWISITAYGRSGRAGNWIGFGDDAAAAAGLSAATGALAGSPTPLFCGDAIADPLTGLHAAVAALAVHRRGGGALVALALRDVAAHAAAFGPPVTPATVRATDEGWDVVADGSAVAVAAPRARPRQDRARPFGADTDHIIGGLDG
jgi:crotonobetainyl-CoA:carnitine CoA-transferase CaiB-like acyl-CoA transferase